LVSHSLGRSVRVFLLASAALLAGLPAPGSGQPLSFPADEGFHPDAAFEMWSLLAHLTTASGQRMGIGVMFFSGRVVGLKVSGTFDLVADESEAEWSATRDLVVPLIGRARHTEGRLDEAYDRSRLWRDSETGLIRATVRTGDAEIMLEFDPLLDAVDFGDVPVGRSEVQRVYALPAGTVVGRLSRRGAVEELTGTGVFQHAWGDSPDPARTGSQLSAHLDDGSALLVYHGNAGSSVHSLSIRRPSGESIVTEAFTAEPGRWDAGDRTDGTTFPVDWRIRSMADSSPVDIRFETTTGGRAVRILGIPFWVGRCRVLATIGSESLQGSGYVLIRGEEPPER
jgi:predicted secreted hydrolase